MTDSFEVQGLDARFDRVAELGGALTELARTGQQSAQSLSDAFLGAGQEMQRALRGVADQGQAQIATVVEAGEGLRALGSILTDTLDEAAQSGELRLADMVRNLSRSLAELALDQWVVNPLLNQVQGFGGHDASGLSPANLSGVLNGLGDLFTTGLAGVLGHRAEGGPVLAGERYLVGEQGPEVFTSTGAGSISPLSSEPPIHITLVAQGSPLDAVRRSERQITAALARAVQQGRRSL